MQNLEEEALEVEEECLPVLSSRPVEWPVQACPNEALAKLMYPLHLLMGNLSLPGPSDGDLALDCKVEESPFPPPIAPADLQLLQWSLLGLNRHQSLEWEAEADHPGGLAPQRWREEDPLAGHLGDSHHEAFCKDLETGSMHKVDHILGPVH